VPRVSRRKVIEEAVLRGARSSDAATGGARSVGAELLMGEEGALVAVAAE
jgi:hypothetical protein